MRYLGTAAAVVATCGLWAGCGSETTPKGNIATATTQALEGCEAPPTVDVDRSIVVHDGDTIDAADFSLGRTVGAILTSGGGVDDPVARQAFLQGMLDSFTESSHDNPVSGLPMTVDLRPGEANLDPAALLDPSDSNFGMVPVGLFNRFDLAPADGAHCGEYRIVYAKPSISGRFFVIFEAVLPNPNPDAGLAGCTPVAEFWRDLTDIDDAAARAAQLESFYYDGLAGFSPVVDHAHYGVPFGQVRGNVFINFVTWQLREWRTGFALDLTPILEVDTVKDNPLAQFYGDAVGSDLLNTERAAFHDDFAETRFGNLFAQDIAAGALPDEFDLVNGLGAGFVDQFNEFQSVSQGNQDAPNTFAAGQFIGLLGDALADDGLDTLGLTATHALNRAGAMTCGGCHQFSNNDALSPTANWPSSAGFVHITETGILSAALNNFFVPARATVLSEFLCGDPVCGNGALEGDEACDDGNTEDGDGCSATCTIEAAEPVCGDGVVDEGEECDDGNNEDGDGCSATCTIEGCGEAPGGCCFVDADCPAYTVCVGADGCDVAGVCLPTTDGCWTDDACGGDSCEGAVFCACGEYCPGLEPSAGTCTDPCEDECLAAAEAWYKRCVKKGNDPDACKARAKARHEDCLEECAEPEMAPPAPPPPAPAPVGSRDAEKAAVDQALDDLRTVDARGKGQALQALKQAVDAARERERATPGAFTRIRRSH